MTPREQRECDRLAHATLCRAIAHWRGSQARAERARELVDLDPRLDRWAELAARSALDDENAVLRAVLALDADLGWRGPESAERRLRPPVGVTIGAFTFLAIPEEDAKDEGPVYSGPAKMQLVVFPSDAIRDFTDAIPIEAYSPGPVNAPDPAPADPEWLRDITEAARTLGEAEAKRRMWLITDSRHGDVAPQTGAK